VEKFLRGVFSWKTKDRKKAMAKAKAAPKEKAAPKAKAKKVDIGAAVKGVLERAKESNASDNVVYTISGSDYKMLEELVG
jgi:hypothetical protein